MHESVLTKDIKMPAATLDYPQYTYQQLGWRDSIPVPLELNPFELDVLALGISIRNSTTVLLSILRHGAQPVIPDLAVDRFKVSDF